jgi:hypothetical protein
MPILKYLPGRNLKTKINKTIILPFVLYACETWSLTVREEHTLRVSEKRVLRRMFGPKREEVALRVEQLHNLYTSPNIVKLVKVRTMAFVGHVVLMGELRNAYNILAGKPEGKRPLGTPRC